MYGISITGKIANNLPTKQIAKAGYYPCQFTSGLWKHAWRPVTFTLVVDNFGIKFVDKHHTQHLHKTLKKHYGTTSDWTGKNMYAYYWSVTLKKNSGYKRPRLCQEQTPQIPTPNTSQTTTRANKGSTNKLQIKSTEANIRR